MSRHSHEHYIASSLEAENKRLKQALARAEMERDILKKRRRTLQAKVFEVRVHEVAPVPISHGCDESRPGRIP